jgi:two-component system, NarL family, sensor histidine kinase BarA
VVVRAMLEEERNDIATIKITVTDTGSGMTEAMQRDLFNAFTQADQSVSRRAGGTGLGLAISKRLAEEMGGEIGVESAWGKGSTFWFTLKVETDENDNTDSFRAFRGQRVVLTEANEHVRLGLYHMLSNWGMEVSEANTLSELATLPVQDTLMVIGLPADRSADDNDIALIEKQLRQKARLVITTAHVERLQRQLADLPGQYRLLGKPATRLRLYDALLEASGDQAEHRDAQLSSQRFNDLNVMVVDDHAGNLRLAEVFLSELGVSVHSCRSGVEAVQMFPRRRFDLIFMDIQMPGMDGIETTLRLREMESEGQRVPIVALTAHALASERQQLLNAGMDDYLTKPVNEKQLTHILERWTRNKDSVSTDPPALDTASNAGKQSHQSLDASLALSRCAGKADLVADMHRSLFRQLPEDGETLKHLREQGDKEGLLERVHRLHGATRYCGTPKLEHCAGHLETLLKQNAKDEAIKSATDELLAEISTLLSQDALSIITKATA